MSRRGEGQPGAEILWTGGGPRSVRYDDIYYAPDGLAEARSVFLQGCGLPEAWTRRGRFTVAELGFGTGLNILALLDLWRAARPRGGRLHVFTVEAHPLAQADARRALAAFPELAELAAPLLRAWPGRARGFERLELPELGAVLDLAAAEAAEALAAWDGAADAWFLDGFAPSRNPEMWRPQVLDLVRARSAPGARLATFTVAGAVRRGLADRGFAVSRAPGHGRKKERLQARLPGAAAEPAASPTVAVVGAGVAGAALARAFRRLGAEVVVIDADPGTGASGNPAALVSPRLDIGGGASARLAAQAFMRAAALYRTETPDAVVAQGVLKLQAGPRDAHRFAALASSDLFPPGSLQALGAAEASARLGEPCEGGLWMADALTVAPEAIIGGWLEKVELVSAEVVSLQRTAAGWRLADEAGATVAEAEVVCLAAGAGLGRWRPEIEPVRGQASWTRAGALPGAAASWGGYAAPLPGGGLLFGATHERGRTEAPATPEGQAQNLATLRARMPETAARIEASPIQSRAGVRASTPDRLPIAGSLDVALFVLGGLGGRGFTFAPLLAEHVAAKALGAPSPLPLASSELLAPDRFERRAARRRAS